MNTNDTILRDLKGQKSSAHHPLQVTKVNASQYPLRAKSLDIHKSYLTHTMSQIHQCMKFLNSCNFLCKALNMLRSLRRGTGWVWALKKRDLQVCTNPSTKGKIGQQIPLGCVIPTPKFFEAIWQPFKSWVLLRTLGLSTLIYYFDDNVVQVFQSWMSETKKPILQLNSNENLLLPQNHGEGINAYEHTSHPSNIKPWPPIGLFPNSFPMIWTILIRGLLGQLQCQND
jgi:hypothetical protein